MIKEWASDEMAPWARYALDRATVDAAIEQAARQSPSTFLFTIKNGQVTLDDKSGWPEHHHPRGDPRVERAYAYLPFFQQCCDALGAPGTGRFAFDVEDMSDHELNLPIFCFQKTAASRNLLMPDPDFISNDFYRAARFDDQTGFLQKNPAAIFVGSTTGDLPLTSEMILAGRNARTRSALYFRDIDNIIFHLPNIVQCDNEATRQLIVGMGIAGEPMGWAAQLAYRYLISMDGNGATCARVVGALLSNAVLLKYHSAHLLYYFKGMKAWQHYIPITLDRNVVTVVQEAAASEALHRSIAETSRQFAQENLSRIHVMEYTIDLLSRYFAQFGAPAVPARPEEPVFAFDAVIHVSNVGNRWAYPKGWARDEGGNQIEGFKIIPGGGCRGADIAYRGFSADEPDGGAWRQGHDYCGTHGQGKPLTGIEIRLSAEAATRYRLSYEAAFADGSSLRSDDAGAALRGSAPLTGFRLIAHRLENAAPGELTLDSPVAA